MEKLGKLIITHSCKSSKKKITVHEIKTSKDCVIK
jgi:hypothetical protein